MNAIVTTPDGGLAWREVADPRPTDGEVLVEVRASAVNRADLAQRAGRYPPPPGASEILGLELAGVVLEPGASDWRRGERVFALVAGGGYAERAAVPAAMLMPIPDGWSFESAAAFPETAFTAYLNVFVEAGAKAGERVLVHGGASGVGTAVIALAREAGCRVFVTAGTPEKTARCRELGAELAIDYRQEDFAERLIAHLGEEPIDVVLDMVGANYLARNLDLLATGGRLIVISTLGGTRAELDLRTLMRKRLTVKGSTLRSRPLAEKVRLKEGLLERFGPALAAGRLTPIVDRVLPITEAETAHAVLADNANIGKVVLRVR